MAGRVAEAVLRDEQAVFPVGSFNPRFGVMLSLPSVVGSAEASEVLWPEMSEDETQALEHGADALRQAVSKILS